MDRLSPSHSPSLTADSSRRGHRKSRRGCGECKARRIKCDETHPICNRCAKGKRLCPFSLLAPSLPAAVSPTASVESHHTQQSQVVETPPLLPPADLGQGRLLHHFMTCEPDLFAFADEPVDPSLYAYSMVKDSLDCPYLFNQVLAISARHLSTCYPDRRDKYIFQAHAYQTHGLSLFTKSSILVGEDNYLQVLLFSWLLGVHKLCDISLDENRADAFNHFLGYLDVYRGVRLVAMQAWQSMLRGRFKEAVNDGIARSAMVGSGVQTQSLKDLITESLGLDETQKQDCNEARMKLQAVFGLAETATPREIQKQSFLHVLSWPLMVGEGFLSAARSRRPEALILIAHLCVLLHWSREHWIIGHVGVDLFNDIVACLGAGWERWLQWPNSALDM